MKIKSHLLKCLTFKTFNIRISIFSQIFNNCVNLFKLNYKSTINVVNRKKVLKKGINN